MRNITPYHRRMNLMAQQCAVPRFACLAAALAAACLALSGRAWAEAGDPPGRTARLSFADGSVSLQPAGVQDWAPAVLNRPLTTGDKIWSDQDGRAELDAGSVVVRLGANTGFSFLELDDNTVQMRITAGTLIVHVRALEQGENAEVDTPNLALTLERPGDYRVEVNDPGDTTVVKVSDGEAVASGAGQTVRVRNQQAITFSGSDELAVDEAMLGAPDTLDSWSLARERRAQEAESRRYLPPDVAGTEDLDESGRWQETPDYGPVWMPTAVPVGWAPYRFGHWVWISPWGWTWVDDAPWGYAPFHYGRWVYWSGSWAWVPCPRHVRPVYAPALVAWVGGGAVTVGAGVGWLPLGPREVYVPGYHVSPTYVQQVNVTNTTIVNNTYITNVYENRVTNINYVNARSPNGITAVPRRIFTSAQPVAGHMVAAPRLPGGGLAARAAPPAIAPERQSLVGRGFGRPAARPSAPVFERPVVARTAPPPAPLPFERQVAAIRANGGRPLPRAQLSQLHAQSPVPAAPVRMLRPAPAGASVGTSMGERERALQSRTIPPASTAAPPVRGGRPDVREAPPSPLRGGRPPAEPGAPIGAPDETPRAMDRPGASYRVPARAEMPAQDRPAQPDRPDAGRDRSYSAPPRAAETPREMPQDTSREAAPRSYSVPPRFDRPPPPPAPDAGLSRPMPERPGPRALEAPQPREFRAPPPEALRAPPAQAPAPMAPREERAPVRMAPPPSASPAPAHVAPAAPHPQQNERERPRERR